MSWEPDDDVDDDEHDTRDTLHDRENPDEADLKDADEPDVERCANCGKYILEDAERCHHCGNYRSHEDAPLRTPKWIFAGVVVVIFIVICWTFFGK